MFSCERRKTIMAKKKSAAQIRRLEKRAVNRGETYECTPPPEEDREETNDEETPNGKSSQPEDNEEIQKRTEIATRLKKELQQIDETQDLKSKDRRTAKRKAEAIASEEAGVPAAELLEWLEQNIGGTTAKEEEEDPMTEKKKDSAIKLQNALKEIEEDKEMKSKDRRSAKRKAEAIASEDSGMPAEELLVWYEKMSLKNTNKKSPANHDPYIAFIGQLSFETTKEELLQHIQSQLTKDFPKIASQTMKIRMLTDPKTKKSRGMAFCEVQDPEILYGLLKLHQTFLNGRRINVERSAGGKKNSESRKSKISQYRKHQEDYFAQVVDNILSEYKKNGELREDELDEGVIALCKRHAGPVVRAAVAKYIEGSGRDMDNPSAYLTYLITKFAKEGVYEDKDENNKQKHSGKPIKRKPESENNSSRSKRLKTSSKFAQSGVDMSQSEGTSDLAKIFPSARRGRGYMM